MPPERARVYMALWGAACTVAAVLAACHWRALAVSRRAYWIGMTRGWKLVTFALALGGIVLVAPRTGDPTWDYWDAGFMAVFTYTTAPWTLGAIVRWRKTSRVELYVAACVWLFSVSFSYDLYLWLRDHAYPATWWANLLASSGLYGMGGAMWSLRGERGKRPSFAFFRKDWPTSLADGDTRSLLPYIAVFMVMVTGMLAPFLWTAMTTSR